MTAPACPSCGAGVDTPYCSQCGQRQPQAEDFTFRRFFTALARELTSSDSRSLATLLALWIPGELTRAFLAHRWRRYLPPLRLYLIISAAFFLLTWDTLYSAQTQWVQSNPEQLAELPPAMREAMSDPALSGRVSELTAWFRFSGVLLLAAWSALLLGPRRHAFGVYLVFATHYYCFDYALNTVLGQGTRFLDFSTAYFMLWLNISMVILGAWLVIAVRRVFGHGWPRCLVTGLLLVVGDLVISMLASQLATGIVAGMRMAGRI